MHHQISRAPLSLSKLEDIIQNKATLSLSEEAKREIQICRDYLDQKAPQAPQPIYGVNTGFGSLYNVTVSHEQLAQLQYNLIISHACGTGEEVPQEIIPYMLFLKIQSLSYGHSGVSVSTVERLIDFFNQGIYPVVYQQGSLGASGDLAPLAHLCLPLIGLGEVYHQGKRMSGKEILAKMNWSPLELQSKEGLALLNGTQFMSAYGAYLVIHAKHLFNKINKISALSLDAYDGRLDAFHPLVHQVRAHAGQVHTAKTITAFLSGSEMAAAPKKHVQDPYSFRCIPQVHGASYDAIQHVAQVITQEINSVTDNPNIFPQEDLVISGGNFHGQPLALALDYLCIALSELGSISERRTYLLISGQRGLPVYLIKDSGINSGMMIPQYTAAGIASQNKQYCTPASADSIVSSNGQEDHVSMGANAATKCFKVFQNVETIAAIELLNANQAIHFRRPLKTSEALEKILSQIAPQLPYIEKDVEMWLHIRKAKEAINAFE